MASVSKSSRVRFRIDLGPTCSVGPGKITLLEGILRTGSLRQAAAEQRMSYRRAWLLLDSLNRSFRERVSTSSVGGAGGGGAELTRFGKELVRRYRAAERRIDTIARAEFAGFQKKIAPGAARRSGPARRRLSR
jgi:molybdate transport system regulatory protein